MAAPRPVHRPGRSRRRAPAGRAHRQHRHGTGPVSGCGTRPARRADHHGPVDGSLVDDPLADDHDQLSRTASHDDTSGRTHQHRQPGFGSVARRRAATSGGAGEQHRDADRAATGPRLPDSADFYSYNDPNGDGWHTGATGGCGTAFLYTALNVNTKDPNQWQEDAGWTFHDLPSANCTINVWIPVSPDATATAHYWVTTGSQNYEDNIAVFTIDQATHQGQWYGVPITVTHPTLYVQIDDPGGTAPGQLIVASAVNIHC